MSVHSELKQIDGLKNKTSYGGADENEFALIEITGDKQKIYPELWKYGWTIFEEIQPDAEPVAKTLGINELKDNQVILRRNYTPIETSETNDNGSSN